MAVPPINKTVVEGDEVQFPCLTKDYATRVKWYKDGISLSNYQDLMTRSYVANDHTLIINPTDSGDYGEYECEALNAGGERQTAKAFLNVQCKTFQSYLKF